MLQIVQPKIDLGIKRLPVNISFVLDCSSSMHGAKIDYTKQAVQFALGHLDRDDTVSVVTFSSEVGLLLPAAKAENKDHLIQQVNSIRAGGFTNLSGGLLEGAAQVKAHFVENQINRIILLTDGMANQGITEPERLVTMVKELRGSAINLSTLGVGEDFQEDLLVDMAETGDGNFYFIASPDTIPEIFKEELQGLLNVTGQNPEISLVPAEGVAVNAVLGYEPQWGDKIVIRLPDIYNGDTKTVLAELRVKAQSAGTMPLLKVGLHYFDVIADLASVKYDVELGFPVTSDQAALDSGIDLKAVKEVEIFKTAQSQKEAMQEADRGDYDKARQILAAQRSKLEKLYEATQDVEVGEQINQLKSNIDHMAHDLYSPMSRKAMMDSTFRLRKKR
jgi:Ca-activated chloride channel family protein